MQWKIENDIDFEEDRPYNNIATMLAILEKFEEALDWLEKAFQLDKISVGISYNIHFRSLHDHPRYQAILKAMGLSD